MHNKQSSNTSKIWQTIIGLALLAFSAYRIDEGFSVKPINVVLLGFLIVQLIRLIRHKSGDSNEPQKQDEKVVETIADDTYAFDPEDFRW